MKPRATRRLGIASMSLVFTTYVVTQAFDINLRKLIGAVGRAAPSLLPSVYRLILCWVLLRYDLIHYFSDRGIFPPRQRFGVDLDELDALRAAGKRVYLFHYGADIRMRGLTQQRMGQPNACTECDNPGAYCLCDDTVGIPLHQAMADRVTAVVSMGDMPNYQPGCVVTPYWPVEIGPEPAPPPGEGPLRVVHATNHPHFKGTRHIEAAVARLQAEGLAIDYQRLQGRPNSEVMELFGQAHLVVEQVLGGMHGYTALEAMSKAKPVITYLHRADYLIEPEACPLLNATPATIEAALRWCVANRAALGGIGAQGRRYVERWATPDAVAARLAQVYLDTGGLPERMREDLQAFIAAEQERRAALPNLAGWGHPFEIADAGR
jgi:hypothetical protein